MDVNGDYDLYDISLILSLSLSLSSAECHSHAHNTHTHEDLLPTGRVSSSMIL